MSFFKSDQVQENLQDIFNMYQSVSYETSRLGNMSIEEKLEHIESCKMLIDKQRTFMVDYALLLRKILMQQT